MRSFLQTVTSALAFASACSAIHTKLGGPKVTIGELKHRSQMPGASPAQVPDTDPSLLYTEYNFTTPIDHFHNESMYEPHSSGHFNMRYWFDAQYYKPGGPVIILQSGETSAVGRLVFLQKGLLHQLIKATNGIGVILEHRYYGTSFPTPDLSTENLRFLTTQQALADEAYFAQHIKFPGLEKHGDLTSKTTAYIGYGGSYAGAFVAFLRKQYPHVFWGTISSSGVTKAIWDYWAYYEPIAHYAPKECIHAQKTLTHIVDNILDKKCESTDQLKEAFGLPNVTHDTDFASVLSYGIGNWQSLNWDPENSSPEFFNYCANISDSEVLYPQTESMRHVAKNLIKEGGYQPKKSLVNKMLNYIGYVNATAIQNCNARNATQEECFGSYNASDYAAIDYDGGSFRSWPYQYCTQWGFLQTGSGVPKDQLPLISRQLDLEYESLVCKYSFNITTPPDTEIINKYGGYDISYPRLAIIDGDRDPWRPATPHAFGFGAKHRRSTASEPFILIENAVHHFDENGLFPNQTTRDLPPAPVRETQHKEVQFVREWMLEWKQHCINKGGCS